MDYDNLFILFIPNKYLQSFISFRSLFLILFWLNFIFLYKTRQTNVSNILKIMFNFGGLLIYIAQVWYVVVPVDVTLNECKAVSYTAALAHLLHKSSLSAFLLWRLRQIENNNIDYWLGIVLFFVRFVFHVS